MISAFIKKLLFVRKFSIIDGKIDLLGSREIMFPPSFFYKIQTTCKDAYTLSKEAAKKNMEELGSKMGAGQGMMNSMKDIYETFGFGPLEVVTLDNKKKEATLRVKDSAIAREYLKENKTGKEPQCKIIAGVLAGMFSFFFKTDVECTETKCLCTKDTMCFFKIKKK